MTERETEIVRLIAEGFTRWKIAELTGLSENTVRRTVRELCWRYDCPMAGLPDAVRAAEGLPHPADKV